jgi:hypothetical protein
MNGQHLTRRIVLTAGTIALALMVTVSGSQDASAELKTGQNHGNKEFFKKDCENAGGTFIDATEKDGITLCVHTDGTIESCDKDGNDCFNIPPKPKGHEVTGGWGSQAGPIVEATTDVGAAAEQTPATDQQTAIASDDDQEPQAKAKHGKGKKRGHGGKGRKR